MHDNEKKSEMIFNCLIVDDEPLARDLIRNHIEKLENFKIVAECSSAIKAMQKLHNNQIDLMFIDIQMPQITGIEFLKTLKNPPKVILTTAYREYALEGFELDVVDYLVKPINFERFLKSVNKFYKVTRHPMDTGNSVSENNKQDDSFIYVKENKRVVKIYLSEILYVEGLSEYIQIYTERKKIITKATLSGFEEKFPAGKFLRIHKSYIVSLSQIEAFSINSVEIKNKELPIGRSYKNTVINTLQNGGNEVFI